MTQQRLPLDVHETRLARIERIAALLQGDARIERASTYFDEANAKRAEAIAKAEGSTLPSGSAPPSSPASTPQS